MSSIKHILEQRLVTTHFQPIVDLQGGLAIGYEALTRGPSNTPLASPRALFDEAIRTRCVLQLEEQCWQSALESAARQIGRRGANTRIFLNALPSTLLHHEFERTARALVERVKLSPSQIVLEISEETRIDDYASFRAAISFYRMAGFGVAVDDAGAGHAGLQMMAEIVPDFIKIDAGLVREVHVHKGRRATVEALLVLARTLAVEVVAEGIETAEELAALRDLGVRVGQGYLLGRPQPAMSSARTSHAPVTADPPSVAIARGPDAVARLAVPTPTIAAGEELSVAVRLFEAQHVDGVVVVNDGAPVGLLMKAHVYEVLGRAFGRELHLRRPVELVASPRALVVDGAMRLDEVSRLAMAREPQALYDHVIVTNDGFYCGIVSVQRLLAAITDARVDAARSANPLTGLPGNAVIERELRDRMRGRDRVALVHIDLDDFKAFNDVYGFHRGDQAITMTAELLTDELDAAAPGTYFLGHIGGDDFLAIIDASLADKLADRFTSEFSRRISVLYDEADRQRGWVQSSDRSGENQVFPLMNLSVAMAFVESNDDRHYAQLLDALSAAKRDAKQRKRERRPAGLQLLGA